MQENSNYTFGNPNIFQCNSRRIYAIGIINVEGIGVLQQFDREFLCQNKSFEKMNKFVIKTRIIRINITGIGIHYFFLS